MAKINKHFVSTLDQHLAEFNASHQQSESQLNEINKHQKIYELRDNPDAKPAQEHDPLWD
jgi:hypothetical protein